MTFMSSLILPSTGKVNEKSEKSSCPLELFYIFTSYRRVNINSKTQEPKFSLTSIPHQALQVQDTHRRPLSFQDWPPISLPFLTILPVPSWHVGSHCKHINKRWVNTLRMNKEPRGRGRELCICRPWGNRSESRNCWREKQPLASRRSAQLVDGAGLSLSRDCGQNNHTAPQSLKFAFSPFVQAAVLFLPPAKGQLPAPLGGIVSL